MTTKKVRYGAKETDKRDKKGRGDPPTCPPKLRIRDGIIFLFSAREDENSKRGRKKKGVDSIDEQ